MTKYSSKTMCTHSKWANEQTLMCVHLVFEEYFVIPFFFYLLICTVYLHPFTEIPFRTRKFTWKHLYKNIWTCLVLFFQNTAGCRFLLMLTMYFRLTNYTWMFCEGYYLHRLLANTFEEERSLAFILTIGWGKTFSLFQFLWYSKA